MEIVFFRDMLRTIILRVPWKCRYSFPHLKDQCIMRNDERNLRRVSKLTLIVSRHVSYSENEI